MSASEPINDEWLRDVKGLAYRDQDGPQVGVSREGLKRVLARLEAAETAHREAEAALGEQKQPRSEGKGRSGGKTASEAKAASLWEEFTVYVETPHLPGHAVPMCGLCGNTGVFDTRETAKTPVGNVSCGVRAYCICPNGRSMKAAGDPL